VTPLWGLLLGWACSDVPLRPCRLQDAAVVLGTGEVWFEPIGDALPFYAGPQGGHHVFVSVLASGLVEGTGDLREPDDPTVSVSIEVDGQEVSTFQDRPRAFSTSPDGSELIGQLVVLAHPDPPAIDRQPAAVSVTVQDRCGSGARDQAEVVLSLEHSL